MLENRKYERISKDLAIRFTTDRGSKKIRFRAECDDISQGGLRIRSERELHPGQRIKMFISDRNVVGHAQCFDGLVSWIKDCDPLGSKFCQQAGISFSPDYVGYKIFFNQVTYKNGLPRGSNIANNSNHEESCIATQVGPAYDGSKTTYKLLRLFGWGPLNNLGYFRFKAPFDFFNLLVSFLFGKVLHLLPEAQKRLILNSANLLNSQDGDRVLDVACGKGMSSFLTANLNPGAIVSGVDILEGNVYAARALYGGTHNLRYFVDDAMGLSFGSNTIEKIMCIEAAFHFPDRQQFLCEAYRVLKKGGKLVVVDFMWKNDLGRPSNGDKKSRLVKEQWQWDDFYSIQQYVQASKLAGFTLEKSINWSRNVTGPLEFAFKTVAIAGSTKLGREILRMINPLLKGLTEYDWKVIYKSASAHDYIRRRVQYTAMVLEK